MLMRKTLVLFAAAIGSLIGNGSRGQQVGGVDVIELFMMLDANNDMVIERAEVPEAGRAAFDRLAKLADRNGDGKVEREEYRDVLERARASAQGAMGNFTLRFGALDANKDGKLDRSEFPGRPFVFERLDLDKDGAISREEAEKAPRLGAMAPAGAASGERIRAMDKDKDGKITRSEFTGPALLFDRIDANKDGSLDLEEIRSFRPVPPGGPAAKKKAAPKNDSPGSTSETRKSDSP